MKPNESAIELSLIDRLHIQKGERSSWISAMEMGSPLASFLERTRSYLSRITTEEIRLKPFGERVTISLHFHHFFFFLSVLSDDESKIERGAFTICYEAEMITCKIL